MTETSEPKATHILFTDQAEWYYVCSDCYYTFSHMQWSGSTRGFGDWRGDAIRGLAIAKQDGLGCEFCGDNGNGGWMIDGHFPAMEKQAVRLNHDTK